MPHSVTLIHTIAAALGLALWGLETRIPSPVIRCCR